MDNSQELYSELDRVCELLEEAKTNLHYWQGEAGIADIRHELTELMLKITLIQEKL